jgi:hypothetical protein
MDGICSKLFGNNRIQMMTLITLLLWFSSLAFPQGMGGKSGIGGKAGFGGGVNSALTLTAQNCTNGGAATTVQCTFTTGSGDFLFITCRDSLTSDIFTVTDSGSNTYTSPGVNGTSNNVSSGTLTVGILYKENAASTTTQTCTNLGTTTTMSMTVYDLQVGTVPTSSSIDISPPVATTDPGNTVLTSGSLTTSNAKDVLFCGFGHATSSPVGSLNNSWLIATNGQSSRVDTGYLLVSSTQSGITVTDTISATSLFVSVCTAFKRI